MADSFWRDDFVNQHSRIFPRNFGTELNISAVPSVFIAVIVCNGEPFINLALSCLERQDYPKDRLSIYFRTNNTDNTLSIINHWIAQHGDRYRSIVVDKGDVNFDHTKYRHHEWDGERLSIIAKIRNETFLEAMASGEDYYFTFDIDTFLISSTLKELVALQLPIVAPFLRNESPNSLWGNFFSDINQGGFHQTTPKYLSILSRLVTGVVMVPLVHCAYLIRLSLLHKLSYERKNGVYEFMNFAANARDANITQYIDNRQIYGINTNVDPIAPTTMTLMNNLAEIFNK